MTAPSSPPRGVASSATSWVPYPRTAWSRSTRPRPPCSSGPTCWSRTAGRARCWAGSCTGCLRWPCPAGPTSRRTPNSWPVPGPGCSSRRRTSRSSRSWPPSGRSPGTRPFAQRPSSCGTRSPTCPTPTPHGRALPSDPERPLTASVDVPRRQVGPRLPAYDETGVAVAGEDHRDPAVAVVVVRHGEAVGARGGYGEQVADCGRGEVDPVDQHVAALAVAADDRHVLKTGTVEAPDDAGLEALVEQGDLEVVAHAA